MSRAAKTRGAKFKPGVAEDAVRVLEAHGYEAMNAFLAAVAAGEPTPKDYAAFVKPSSVYLAFFGEGGEARYLKIGIAENVAVRMSTHRSSCPLPCVRLLAVELQSRGEAVALEAHLLSHMAADRMHGEWVRVSDADGPIESLNRAASDFCGRPIEFVAG